MKRVWMRYPNRVAWCVYMLDKLQIALSTNKDLYIQETYYNSYRYWHTTRITTLLKMVSW